MAPSQACYLAGPTAVGKTQLSIELAQRLNAEIVTADSMQVYQGLDIGTAKPSVAEQQRVPHHLLDLVSLRETFDVQRFLTCADEATQLIQQRGHIPLFSGGTGFYFKSHIEGIDPLPAPDHKLRSEITNTPLPELLEELKRTDPDHYDQMDRQNPRRVYRAIEIIRLTGQPASAQRRAWDSKAKSHGSRIVVLSRSRDELRHRIGARVDAMMTAGLVEETQSLLQEGLAENPTARQALGYRQILEYLQQQRSLADTIAQIKTKTWQFAKRQLTWFRKQPNTLWINLSEIDPAQQTEKVYNVFRECVNE